MSTSTLTSKNRVSLPNDIVDAAGLRLDDEILWTVDAPGEIHGRKLSALLPRAGKLAKDVKTGRFYWAADFTYEAMEDAALNANATRHD